MKEKLSIKKIPLKGLLEILTDLYEEGVNYIDISSGEGTELKDILKIDVLPEYMAEDMEDIDEDEELEYIEEFPEPIEDEEEEDTSSSIEVKKLSEDDLNNLA
jgi:hypothetical protein